MVRHHIHRSRAQFEHQRESTIQRTILSAEDGQQKGMTRISKTPAAKTKAFQGVGGGSMEGIIMARNSWLSKRCASLIALAIDALQQEEFATGAAQPIGQQPADRRSHGGQQAIEPEMALIVPDINGQDRIHGNRNRGGIEQGYRAHAPKAQLGQSRQQHKFHLAMIRAKNAFKQGPLPPDQPSNHVSNHCTGRGHCAQVSVE